jgi:outer membrane protein assembly factor BamB
MTQSTPTPPPAAPRIGYLASLATALVAGAFVLTLATLLAAWHAGSATDDLLNSQEMSQLRTQLLQAPDMAAQTQARENLRLRDQALRQNQVNRLTAARTGGWLMLTGTVVLLAAASLAALYRKRRPVRRPAPGETGLAAARRSQWSVVGMAAILVGGGMTLGLVAGGSVLNKSSATDGAPAVARTFPSWEELGKQWPRFRGVAGTGVSAYENVPTTWNAATGENILWKTPLPMPGMNSPIVWGDRIFMAGAVVERVDNAEESSKVLTDKRSTFCFDAGTGQLLWQKPVETPSGKAAPTPRISKEGSYATSTMVTDGQAVFVIFPNGDVASFDFSGTPLWARCVGPFNNMYGHAASLDMYKGRLLLQLDQGEVGKTKSVLLALDASTGKTVYEVRRPMPASWGSPIVIHTDQGDQFVTAGMPWVVAYNPENGTELWKAKVLYGDVAPSPTFAGGTVYTANASAKLAAIRTNGQGDVTETGVAWTAEDGLPDICSPLANGKRVWIMTTEGKLTCYNAADGKKIYEKEFAPPDPDTPVIFKSSPALAGNRLYVTEERGVTHILDATDDAGKEIATANLGEKVDASLVFQDGRIYIRGAKHLFAIGKK